MMFPEADMIRRFLRGDETLYDLLDASAREARHCAVLLKEMIQHLDADRAPHLEGIAISRRKIKKVSQEITENLCHTFITPLDREDIEALNSALYKIPKTIEKIAERLTVSPLVMADEFIARQVNLLDQGTSEVVEMVLGLRKKTSLEVVQDHQERLQYIEGDGDRMLLRFLEELYTKKTNAIEVIILKDIYELLERVIDRCRDCGNVVFRVVLKYS